MMAIALLACIATMAATAKKTNLNRVGSKH